MHKLTQKLRKFQRDEDGYFAVLFGIMVISLTATAGAVVDFVGVQNARSDVQNALDTTALALQPQITQKTEAQIKVMAQDLIDDIADAQGLTVTIDTVDEVEADGKLFIDATVTVPLHFVGLVGVDSITARVTTQVTKKALAQEIILVLDNSGSMGHYSRLSNLKTAAVNATNILMGSGATSTDVKMGIVPFTSYVNIGPHHSAAPWLDMSGQADISNDNFDNDDNDSTPYTGHVNRLSLYAQLGGVSWGGCVEARAHTSTGTNMHLDTDDTTPVNSNKNTLFTPLFMPDERSSSSSYNNSYISDSGGSCSSAHYLSTRERQERLCKYSGSVTVSGSGPNDDCPALALLPLTNTKASVTNQINAMTASGGTNIHMGAVWGFRALSPTLPFDEGDAYDVGNLSKIIILMTDGENTNPSSSNINGSAWHSAYGYPANGRLGAVGWSTNQIQGEMDNRTEESCANAKAQGITIYTIGLSPPTTATQNMLTNCATSPSHAHFPSAPSELDSVFTTIANEIQAARIAQ